MSSKQVLLSCLMLGAIGVASAQTACPQGVQPGDPRCGPGGSGGGGWDLPAGKVYTRWKSTWGAMAEDKVVGVIGTSTGQFSRRAAQRAAVGKCKSMGGERCRAVYDYKNTCAVVAEPIELLPAMMGVYQDGPTIEEASELGLSRCEKHNNDHACKIIYSNCTAPVLVYE